MWWDEGSHSFRLGGQINFADPLSAMSEDSETSKFSSHTISSFSQRGMLLDRGGLWWNRIDSLLNLRSGYFWEYQMSINEDIIRLRRKRYGGLKSVLLEEEKKVLIRTPPMLTLIFSIGVLPVFAVAGQWSCG
jgi:hypothetical protein